MSLYVVRSEQVPVEQLRAGDLLVLPNGRRVTVELVEQFDDERLIVRWWRRAEHGEPGAHTAILDGRYLGSTTPVEPGHLFEVDRG